MASPPQGIGGGGSSPTETFAKIVKSVDEIVSNDIALQNDDELKFTPKINTSYGFILTLWFDTISSSDFKCAFSLPTGATGIRNNQQWNPSAESATIDITTELILVPASGIYGLQIAGKVDMGSTAGDVNFQWAQRVAVVEDTKVLKGSQLLAWEA